MLYSIFRKVKIDSSYDGLVFLNDESRFSNFYIQELHSWFSEFSKCILLDVCDDNNGEVVFTEIVGVELEDGKVHPIVYVKED